MSESIFERRKISLSIAGRSYEFEEQPRRKTREIVAAIHRILELRGIVLGDDGVIKAPASAAFLLANDALDFFYQHHEQMNADRSFLDEADEEEILNAFMQYVEFVLRPFVSKRAETADQ